MIMYSFINHSKYYGLYCYVIKRYNNINDIIQNILVDMFINYRQIVDSPMKTQRTRNLCNLYI